jgi:hypothetical protein
MGLGIQFCTHPRVCHFNFCQITIICCTVLCTVKPSYNENNNVRLVVIEKANKEMKRQKKEKVVRKCGKVQ